MKKLLLLTLLINLFPFREAQAQGPTPSWKMPAFSPPSWFEEMKPESSSPFARLFPPHKQTWTSLNSALQNSAVFVQSFQPGATPILAGGVQQDWAARRRHLLLPHDGNGKKWRDGVQQNAADDAGQIDRYITVGGKNASAISGQSAFCNSIRLKVYPHEAQGEHRVI